MARLSGLPCSIGESLQYALRSRNMLSGLGLAGLSNEFHSLLIYPDSKV